MLKSARDADERRMFGGVCFTIKGNMACGLVKDELVVRVGPNKYEDALEQSHVRPMNGYVFSAPSGMKSESSLKRWVGAGVAHARTLPPKSSRGKRFVSRTVPTGETLRTPINKETRRVK